MTEEHNPMTEEHKKRTPPFINDQAVLRLTAPASQRHEWLGLRFAWRKFLPREGSKQSEKSLQEFDSRYAWEEIPDRWALLTDRSIRLLCVVDDAGMGKSISLEQIQYARQQADKAHLAIRCEFHELPRDWRGYLGKHAGQGVQEFLLSRLMNGCHVSSTDPGAMAALRSLLHWKVKSGQFTLLVDALDQSNRHQDPEAAARALADFLKAEPNVRCVVSGRPFAVAHYWDTLFSKCGDRPQDQWDLVQLAEFSREQAFQFVGKERAAKLNLVQAEVLAIPRDLETIIELDPDELTDIRTSADVYWKCFQKTLDKAMRDQQFRIQSPTAQKVFALLAFETVKRGLFAAVGGQDRKGLEGEEFQDFVDQLLQERESQLKRYMASGETLDNLLGTLGALNIVIDPGIFSVESDANPNNPVLRQLYFRNRTLQDFLAAYWLVRHSTPEDRQWLKQLKYVQGDEKASLENADRYQLWKFVCEMPAAAQTKQREGFVDLAGSLLLPSDHPQFTVRSTEMIWRAWPGMLQSAGLLTKKNWYEPDLEPLTRQLQLEARKLVESGQQLPAADSSAKEALLQFLGEYHRIRLGQHGKLDREARRLSEVFETGFRRCPPNAEDPLESWFGNGGLFSSSQQTDRPENRRWIEQAFLLHEYPLTNDLQHLFDSAQASRFSDYKRVSADGWCPAIYLSWYDSWCVAAWFSSRLPSEFEWEYACRAAPGTDAPNHEFCFGDGTQELGQYAWFGENSAYRTHPVYSDDAAGRKRPNAFGLYHVHGQVWEWCGNWWADNAADSKAVDYVSSSRCLRGGAFNYFPEYCRSANRGRRNPSVSNFDIGVRLSRAASD
jgi:formylglycine-generating enzyme required for sulfatase activity